MSDAPRALQVLVGLTEVDPTSTHYTNFFPGFNGRHGAEGCGLDVHRILELTHYMGFDLSGGEIFINTRATHARVLNVIQQTGASLRAEDILFLYFSCHGETFGEGDFAQKAQVKLFGNSCAGFDLNPDQNAISGLLLHDQPCYNFEILEALEGVQARVFIMIDACHSSLGASLTAHLGQAAGRSWRGGYVAPKSQGGNGHSARTAFSMAKKRLRSAFETGHSAGGPQIIFYGAARHEQSALGGSTGSVFTNYFVNLWRRIGLGHSDYNLFFDELKSHFPDTHQPTLEITPAACKGKFAMQHVFQIQ
jgi:Caspase domain